MKPPEKNPHGLSEHFFRHHYARMVAVLVRYFGLVQVEIAEDVVQDTLIEAMEQWSVQGIPHKPEAWLFDVAKKKTINYLKRNQLFHQKILPNLQKELNTPEEIVSDSTLRMIFACCHPDLPQTSQIALALKTLCGLSVAEIARALLTSEANVNKRLYRAKKKFREESIPFIIPLEQIDKRLDSVFICLYLLFNEGYFSLHTSHSIRLELCYEAIRLLKQILGSFPKSSQALALLSLMLFSVARFESRLSPSQELLNLEQQNRALWDKDLIAEATQYLSLSIQLSDVNTYQLQAGIMAEHCLAPSFEDTNWSSIYKQYCLLQKMQPSVIVQYNQAIARFFGDKPATALADLLALKDEPLLSKNAQYYLSLGILFRKVGQDHRAKGFLQKALAYASSPYELSLIERHLLS